MKMESAIRLINVENIIPNRFQPRLEFDNDGLNELADSIRVHGIVQPLVLRRVQDKFEIIAGERRYKAAMMVGLNAVPAIIADLDDNESAEVAVVENIIRRNLSSIEEARSYKKLLERNYVTQEQLAKRLGTSQANIANKIRLLNLDPNVQDALLKEKISERHARSLLRVTDKKKQVELLNKVIQERMTVKMLDDEIDKILGSYEKSGNAVGAISTNRNDIDINNIMNNSVDIEPVNTGYKYINPKEEMKKKKDSIFFNNLENESVNMNTSLNFGFNPFSSQTDDEEDLDILTLDEVEEIDADDIEEKEQVEVVEKFRTPEDVLKGIKKLIDRALTADIEIESESFDFDDKYQFIIRIGKKDK